MSNENLVRKVAEAMAHKDIAKAEALVNATPMTEKDPHIYRAHYMVTSNPLSTLYNPEKARQILEDMISTFLDSWSSVELARVLLANRGNADDVTRAEDLLTRHREKDPTAKYWLAEIYSKGLNIDSKGAPIFDLKEALILYRDIFTKSTGKMKLTAMERYCKVSIDMGNLSPETEIQIYGYLQALILEDFTGAKRVFSQFLMLKLNDVIETGIIPGIANTDEGFLRMKKIRGAVSAIESAIA